MGLFAARHAPQARYEAGIDSLKRRSIVVRSSLPIGMTKRPSCDRLFRFCEYGIAFRNGARGIDLRIAGYLRSGLPGGLDSLYSPLKVGGLPGSTCLML